MNFFRMRKKTRFESKVLRRVTEMKGEELRNDYRILIRNYNTFTLT
jgi:hypothetical protein